MPSKTGNAEKILAVNSSANGLEWVAKPTSTTYTNGDGIDITSDVVSAKAGTGLSIGTSTKTGPVTEPQYSSAYTSGDLIVVDSAILLTSDIINAIDNNETITVVVPQYVDPNTTTAPWFNYTNRYVIGAHNNDSGLRAPLSAPSSSYYGTFTLNKSNIPSDYLSKWDSVKASNTTRLELMGCSSSSFNGWPGSTTVSALGNYHVFDITMSKTVVTQNAINVDNPLPATLGTAGQVLAVNSGATGVEWVTAQGGSSDVFIIESSTTLGDVYTAYTSGKVLIYKASTGEMYYVSSDGAGLSSVLNLYGTYTMPYLNTRLYVKTIYVGIFLNDGQPTSPTQTFGQSILDSAITTSIPLPNIGSGDVGKILQVTNNGLAWVNNVPIEVVASLPASPTAGVLYIVTGA